MREKVRAARPVPAGRFDVKHSAGGMMDVEFAVQYLVLAHGRSHPQMLDNKGNIALLQRAEAAGLLPAGVGTRAAPTPTANCAAPSTGAAGRAADAVRPGRVGRRSGMPCWPCGTRSSPWRWWTSAFVHWSPAHLGRQPAGRGGARLVRPVGGPAGLGDPLLGPGLAARPPGPLGRAAAVALRRALRRAARRAAVVSVALLVAPTPPRQRAGLLLVAALCVKLLCENPAAQPAGLRAAAGIPELVLATRAHAGGALAGWGLALVAVALSACTKPRQPS
jgi:hypothetical protein